MKFERLNESNGKVSRVFLYGLITGVGLLIIFNLFLTKAKYKVVDSAKLVNSTINYSNADLNVIAMYLKEENSDNYKSIDSIPIGNYDIDTKESYCVVKDSKEKIYNVMEYKESKVYIGIDKKGTKCYVYFDKAKPASEKQLANLNLKVNTTEEGCPTIESDGNAKIESIYSGEGGLLCEGEDDYGTTYYFRGVPTNNWVKIGNYYWQIVRINGDGTIRLIYNGDSTNRVGSNTIAKDNIKYNNTGDNAYVGFMYGQTAQSGTKAYENTHYNSNESIVLTELNDWYKNTFPEAYKQYLDGNAGFCNDRTPYDGYEITAKIDKNNYGYGEITTFYGPYIRFQRTHKPTFKCHQTEDLFTTLESSKGNKALSNPVGLITMDEAEYAGGYISAETRNYYLYNGKMYWTISPNSFQSSIDIITIYNSGNLGIWNTNSSAAIRPVINLKADTPFTSDGNGTTEHPFTVKLN